MKNRKQPWRGATPHGQVPPRKKSPAGLMVAAGVAAGIALTFVLEQSFSPQNPDQAEKNAQQLTSAEEVEPVFDFYTSLPETEISLQAHPAASAPTKNKNTTLPPERPKKAIDESSPAVGGNGAGQLDTMGKVDAELVKSATAVKKSGEVKIKAISGSFQPASVAGENKVSSDEAKAEPPESKKHITADQKYFIRAGSFKSSNDARKLLAQLLLLGIKPHIEKAEIKDQIWFRVQIGPLNSREQAVKIDRLLSENKVDSLIVRR